MTAPIERWAPGRLADLAGLCAVALPDERLLPEDLEACCFDDPVADPDGGRVGPSITLGIDGPDGRPLAAVAVAFRRGGGLATAHLQLLVVHPDARGRGLGRALVEAAEREAADRGAARVCVGAAAPFYLFTGVDTRWTDALCCFERLGYERSGVELDLVCPTRLPPADGPPGLALVPVRSDAEAGEVIGFAERCYPHWRAEFAKAAAAGTAVLARRDGATVGAAAHSVNRFGVVGPVGVDPDLHAQGVGAALVRALLADLAVAGCEQAEIAWTSTVRFYARCCRARVLRASLQLGRWL